MSEKIVVPEGMLKAACEETKPTTGQYAILRDGLGSAIRWLMSNDTSTQKELFDAVQDSFPIKGTCTSVHKVAFESGANWQRNWLRNLFLASEPEIGQDGTVEYLSGTTRPVAIWWRGSRWPIVTLSSHEDKEVPNIIKDLIPKEGEQVEPFYYGITPEEIDRTKKIALEAFRRGRGLGNQK